MSRAKVKIPDGYDATECRQAQPGELFLYGETVKTAVVRTVGPHWILKPKSEPTPAHAGCKGCEDYRRRIADLETKNTDLERRWAVMKSEFEAAKMIVDDVKRALGVVA